MTSPRFSRSLAAAATIALFAGSGCSSSFDHITVDPGVGYTAAPGDTGLFIEYDRGGHWTVTNVCGDDLTAQWCSWEVFITAQSGAISVSDTSQLVPPVGVAQNGADGLVFIPDPSQDVSVFSFDTDPGASVELANGTDSGADHALFHAFTHFGRVDGTTNPAYFTPAAP
jgi:hypothetical protein